jgi:hypothetical protein
MDLSGLWLDPIPAILHDQARTAIEARNASLFLSLAESKDRIHLVFNNTDIRLERGLLRKPC